MELILNNSLKFNIFAPLQGNAPDVHSFTNLLSMKQIRPRRNRRSQAIRSSLQETSLHLDHLVYPLFLAEGSGIDQPIGSLPGQRRLSEDYLLKEIESCLGLGISSYILFPAVPDSYKDSEATYGSKKENFYLKTINKCKNEFGDAVCLYSDVAMDPYSSDGHDGLVKNGEILNDETLPILADMSLAQAQAGIDYIGPSDMMDHRVEYIRDILDTAGFQTTGIMSYTAKYASAFYGPFRDALDSAPKSGDKKTYQMDPANRKEALLEAELDAYEGADIMMVKPAIHYLDIISDLYQNFNIPIAAYHVSGECAMLYAAIEKGWIDKKQGMLETLLSIRRAGASIIMTYLAKDVASFLAKK